MNNVQEPDCAGVFAHPQFIRNRPEMLSQIRRKAVSQRKSIEFEAAESLAPSDSPVKTSSPRVAPAIVTVTHPPDHTVMMAPTNPLETLGFVSRIEQRLGSNAAATQEIQERYVFYEYVCRTDHFVVWKSCGPRRSFFGNSLKNKHARYNLLLKQ